MTKITSFVGYLLNLTTTAGGGGAANITNRCKQNEMRGCAAVAVAFCH